MSETIESIAKWEYETFGTGPLTCIYLRAMEEMGELAYEIRNCPADSQKICAEVADVIITLVGILVSCRRVSAVDDKMQINRQRSWHKNGDGTGYHIKEDVPTRYISNDVPGFDIKYGD